LLLQLRAAAAGSSLLHCSNCINCPQLLLWQVRGSHRLLCSNLRTRFPASCHCCGNSSNPLQLCTAVLCCSAGSCCHSNRLILLLLLLLCDVVWVCELQPNHTLPQPQRISAAS
jgi:hypothetical protein